MYLAVSVSNLLNTILLTQVHVSVYLSGDAELVSRQIMLMSSSSLASGKSPATGPDGYCTATSRTAISVAISWTSLSEYVDRDYPNWYDVQCNCSDANSMVDIAIHNTSAAVNGLRVSTTYGFLVREWSGHSGSLIGWNACYVTTLAGKHLRHLRNKSHGPIAPQLLSMYMELFRELALIRCVSSTLSPDSLSLARV